MKGFDIMAATLTFKRTEKKYLMSEEKYNRLREAIEPYMQVDDYGLTAICNIYYDTPNYDLIRRSLDAPMYKEKLRLRSYGIPKEDSTVFVEIKKKYNGIVYKRRTAMNYREATDYLLHGSRPSFDSQILHEIDYFIKLYRPEPKLFLAYDRIALFGRKDPEFRMTFDTAIRSRTDDLDLSHGDRGTLLFGNEHENTYLLEVKINGSLPLWLSHILTENEIYPTSFSKYGEIYKKQLSDNNRILGEEIFQ